MAHACRHCGTALAPREEAFCCGGCSAAWDLIHGSGLEAYYERREALPPRPQEPDSRWSEVEPERAPDGTLSIRCVITGLRCASCVWVTERVLEQTPGVSHAHVSYATGRASIEWDPARLDLPSIINRITTLGYAVRPTQGAPGADRELLARLGVAAFCTANVMMVSVAIYLGWLGPMDPRFTAFFRWVTLVLATPVVVWSAAPFFATAWIGMKHRIVHMDLPIALAVGGVYAHGLWGTVAGHETYLDSATMLVTLLLVGRVLEARGRHSAAQAAASLAAKLPTRVRRIENGRLEVVSPDELCPGDVIEVGSGEEIGADGIVTAGSGEGRMAIVTGESELVALAPGSSVVAGAVLVHGSVTISVERSGDDTLVHQMAATLVRSLDQAAPLDRDPIAPWFTGATLVFALLSGLAWAVTSTPAQGLRVAVAVLVVACPCALALAGPLSNAAGLGAAARRGLLMRSGPDLLALATIDTVVLDKTGTVTLGEPVVIQASDRALEVGAALERASIHPIAKAIVAAAAERGIPLDRAAETVEVAGVGLTGSLHGVRWTAESGGPNTVRLIGDDGSQHEIQVQDTLRVDAAEAIDELRTQGLHVVLLTGDRTDVGRSVSESLGGLPFEAEVSPLKKVEWVTRRQQDGHRVLFLGDGLNDGPALAAADVGLAMEGGAGSTILAGQGVVAGGRLGSVLSGIGAAREATRSIRRSRHRAIAYNGFAVSAAMLGWINPLVAATLMPLSSLMVIWEAKRIEPRVEAARSRVAKSNPVSPHAASAEGDGARLVAPALQGSSP